MKRKYSRYNKKNEHCNRRNSRRVRESIDYNDNMDYLELAQRCETVLNDYGAAFGDYAYFDEVQMRNDLNRLQQYDEEQIEDIDTGKTLYNSMKKLLDDFSDLELQYYRIIKGSDLEDEFDWVFDEL
jgi:hypothetical protein